MSFSAPILLLTYAVLFAGGGVTAQQDVFVSPATIQAHFPRSPLPSDEPRDFPPRPLVILRKEDDEDEESPSEDQELICLLAGAAGLSVLLQRAKNLFSGGMQMIGHVVIKIMQQNERPTVITVLTTICLLFGILGITTIMAALCVCALFWVVARTIATTAASLVDGAWTIMIDNVRLFIFFATPWTNNNEACRRTREPHPMLALPRLLARTFVDLATHMHFAIQNMIRENEQDCS